jgi:DnaJ-class molecular chaperone
MNLAKCPDCQGKARKCPTCNGFGQVAETDLIRFHVIKQQLKAGKKTPDFNTDDCFF